ncbi:hypothetical protein ACOSQ3_019900 [Xanthoceras sorbifolium]
MQMSSILRIATPIYILIYQNLLHNTIHSYLTIHPWEMIIVILHIINIILITITHSRDMVILLIKLFLSIYLF